jgi:hypothetical protein
MGKERKNGDKVAVRIGRRGEKRTMRGPIRYGERITEEEKF